jgi:hypothetical protein
VGSDSILSFWPYLRPGFHTQFLWGDSTLFECFWDSNFSILNLLVVNKWFYHLTLKDSIADN